MNENLPNIGITLGDINGIGPEVIIKALANQKVNRLCNPIIYGSGKHLSRYKNLLNQRDWSFVTIQNPKEAKEKQINLINCWNGEFFDIELGKPTKTGGALALKSLQRATEDLKKGYLQGIVTAPINKDMIQGEGFDFPGHTEFFGQEFGNEKPLMFMVSPLLRVAVVTGHLPLEKVKNSLTSTLITEKIEAVIASLRVDFGIFKPKIAVLGVNPHAGENGLLGKEEIEVIQPAMEKLKIKGNLLFGPYPADGFFAASQWKKFDAVIAMYHDQGLTPFKMLAFEDGVNFTAGLPIVRTSPDHGTAYAIAGKNEADAGSMLHAIYAAVDIAKHRKEYNEIEANSLRANPVHMEKPKREKQL